MGLKTTVLIMAMFALSACVGNGAQQVQWDTISGSNHVAKVSGIKSLMQPGFY